MRVTTHNGRYHIDKNTGEKEAFNPKHNDRNFDISKAEHIDPTKTPDNKTWFLDRFYSESEELPKSIDDQELDFYTEHFHNHLKKQNAKHLKARNYKRVQTPDDYRSSVKTCPEEEILQIGKYGEESVPAKVLEDIMFDFITWHQEKYPQAIILNVSLHVDEPQTADHFHKRRVWIAHDEDGNEIVSQSKALEEMGVPLPDPSKKVGQHNNRKMTYTKDCREKFIELALERGYELELEPLEASQTGLTHSEYKKREIERKVNEALENLDKREAEINEKASKIDERALELNKRIRTYNEKSKALQERTEALNERERQVALCEDELNKRKMNIDREVRERVAKRLAIQEQAENAANSIKSFDKSRELPFP